MSNPVLFRSILDQSEMLLSERFTPVPNEMLAMTWKQLWDEMQDANSVSAPFELIRKCGPPLQGMATLALMQSLAAELCRRSEMEAESEQRDNQP